MMEICHSCTFAQQRRAFERQRLRFILLRVSHILSALLGAYAILFTYVSLSQVTHEKRLRDVQRLVMIGLLDAESGQRAFLLTHDTIFLVQYNAGMKALDLYEPVYTQALRDGESKRLFQDVSTLLALKKAEMQLTITTHNTVSSEAAIAIVRNRSGHHYTEQIYDLLSRIQQIEAHQVAPFELWHAPRELDIHDPNHVMSPSALLMQLNELANSSGSASFGLP